MTDRTCDVEMAGGEICGRKTVRDGKCIFHVEDKSDGEAERFKKEFEAELDRMMKDNTVKELDFTRFIFPEVSFAHKQFEKPVNFTDATFEEADFREATFERVDFRGATFIGKADFYKAKFKEAYFPGATFEKAYFSVAKFKEAYFSDATFIGKAEFIGATFIGKAHFVGTRFGVAVFAYAVFYKPKEVRFQDVDLSNVCFTYADVTDVDFVNVTWAKKRSGLGSRLRVAEEELIGRWEVTYEGVAQLYCRLRRNYESNYRFIEAGDFFIGEMEMRRLNVDTRFKNRAVKNGVLWLKRNLSLLAIYKYLSLYGESYHRLTVLAISIILSFAAINWLTGGYELGESLINSLAAFFHLRAETASDLVERLSSIPILGLLFIALKRKLERRK